VLLKVAHPGTENTDRLKREAEFLKSLKLSKENEKHSYFPTWLPPYANTPAEDKADAYGRAMLGGHLFYYHMSEYFPGDPLRDVLTKNPQLWINHVGWLMIGVASAIAVLQSKGKFHFGLTPESVLVSFANKANVPVVMLADLGIASDSKNIAADWYSFFVPPAYTAPELIKPQLQQAGYHTDTYGLGLVLYEMLVGEPCYTFKLRGDEEVYGAVQNNQRIRMNRTEDVKAIADIATQAVNPNPGGRHQNAAQLVKELITTFGEVPDAKGKRKLPVNTILLFVIAVLTVAFLITLTSTLLQI
jgi:serine/threonine protein kinase